MERVHIVGAHLNPGGAWLLYTVPLERLAVTSLFPAGCLAKRSGSDVCLQ